MNTRFSSHLLHIYLQLHLFRFPVYEQFRGDKEALQKDLEEMRQIVCPLNPSFILRVSIEQTTLVLFQKLSNSSSIN